jgi:hypothetical protein
MLSIPPNASARLWVRRARGARQTARTRRRSDESASCATTRTQPHRSIRVIPLLADHRPQGPRPESSTERSKCPEHMLAALNGFQRSLRSRPSYHSRAPSCRESQVKPCPAWGLVQNSTKPNRCQPRGTGRGSLAPGRDREEGQLSCRRCRARRATVGWRSRRTAGSFSVAAAGVPPALSGAERVR